MKAPEERSLPMKGVVEGLTSFRMELAASQRQVLARLDSELEKIRVLQPPLPPQSSQPMAFLHAPPLLAQPSTRSSSPGPNLPGSIFEDEPFESECEVKAIRTMEVDRRRDTRQSHYSNRSRPSGMRKQLQGPEMPMAPARASFLAINSEYAVERLRELSVNEFGEESIEMQQQEKHEKRWPMLLNLVRSQHFESISLAVTCLNAIWIALDLEFNSALTVLEASPHFVAVELCFLAYFGAEVVVRYMSYSSTRRACRDRWFLFDVVLVLLMIVEIWLVPIFGAIAGGASGTSSGIGDASVLRMLRMVRITRVIRVASYMPEVMIIIKGLTVASRSVFFTFVLLLLINYIFAIAFRQLAQDTPLEMSLFPSVHGAVLNLVVQCVMPDQEPFFQQVSREGGWLMGMLVLIFILLCSLIVINMLIGVLVEAVQTVSDVEHEAIQIAFAKKLLWEMLSDGAQPAESILTEEEFFSILDRPEALTALSQLGVDHFAAKEYGKLLMEDGQPISFGELLESILLLRGSNQTTVKDLVTLRRYVGDQFVHIQEILHKMAKSLSHQKIH